MEPALEDGLDLLIFEAPQRGARLALRPALAAMREPERIQMAHDVLVAGGERARHLGAQDQEVSDEPGLDALAIWLGKGGNLCRSYLGRKVAML